jgi:hypothetical protein
MFWTTGPELTDHPPALFFLLLALDRVVRYLGRSGTRHLGWAGFWMGLAACFKHDVAAYMATGTALSLFLSWWILRERRPRDWESPVRAAFTIAMFALAALAPLAGWIAWKAGPDAWNDLFVFPATVFPRVYGEQYPPLIPNAGPILGWLLDLTDVRKGLAAARTLSPWIMLNAPPVVFMIGLWIMFAARRRLEASPDWRYF